MISSLLGIKLKQSQVFDSSGKRLPVTYISSENLRIISLRNEERDGYSAVVLGIGSKRDKSVKKPLSAFLKKNGVEQAPLYIKESREKISEGDKVGPVPLSEILKEGDLVKVRGISKGKGFQGGVKRHHFKGGPRTHGQSDRERAPGAIGQTTTPGRVYKGKRMAGRMGNDTITVKNLRVYSVDPEKNIIVLKGLVPGAARSLLEIRKV